MSEEKKAEQAKKIVLGVGVKTTDMTGKFTLKELCAFLKMCRVFVGSESDPMHIATAFDTQAVAILSPTDAKLTGPYKGNTKIIQYQVDCQPCRNRNCKSTICMHSITVSEVFEEVKKKYIIKPSSFGDIVKALPCANALKQTYHHMCEISWVVFNRWASLLKICSGVDKIIKWDREKGLKGFFEVLKKINETEYDLIMDLQGLLRSVFLVKFARAKIKLGAPGMKEFSNLLIKEVYPENAGLNSTLRNLEPVRFLTGKIFHPEVNMKIDSNADEILQDNGIFGDFISLIPFARGKGKNWSVLNYNKLIDLIKKEYFNAQIVILGSVKDFGKLKSEW